MKRVVIGGFLSLIGSIWCLAMILFVSSNLVSSWSNPPGRFWETAIQQGVVVPLVLAVLATMFGIVILVIEYFKKDGNKSIKVN